MSDSPQTVLGFKVAPVSQVKDDLTRTCVTAMLDLVRHIDNPDRLCELFAYTLAAMDCTFDAFLESHCGPMLAWARCALEYRKFRKQHSALDEHALQRLNSRLGYEESDDDEAQEQCDVE